ncbi:MAG: hypothetical protein IPK00_24560 [Deltaproteobacteria bacterium]|nr:hypothetical protein [Deltaproteobacteria bacterium]
MGWRDWLDWEESIFRVFVRLGRRLRSGSPKAAEPPGTVVFEDEFARLSVLAQLLAGEPVRVRRGPGIGGVRGGDLILPTQVCLGEDPELAREAYRVQIVVASGLARWSRDQRPPQTDRYEGALDALRVVREIVELQCREWPRLREMHDRVMARVLELRPAGDAMRLPRLEAELEAARRLALAGGRPWEDGETRARLVGPRTARRRSAPIPIWGEWLSGAGEAQVASPAGDADPAQSEAPMTEREAPDVGDLRRVSLEAEDAESSPPNVAVERAETLDRYRGGRRDIDAADELDAHLDALEQADLGDLLRSNQTAHSLLKADLELGLEVADARSDEQAAKGIAYDEWDARRGAYRAGWCTVHPGISPPGDAAWSVKTLRDRRQLVRRLRLRLEAHRAGLRATARQLDGEDVDLTAAIDDHVARLAGRGDDPRLYVRRQKRRRDFVTTVLIDVSMSTDSWVDGRRILDVAREASLVLGEVADQLGDRLRILAFASETRNRCHVWQVFAAGESWQKGRLRLAGLAPRDIPASGRRSVTPRRCSTPNRPRVDCCC